MERVTSFCLCTRFCRDAHTRKTVEIYAKQDELIPVGVISVRESLIEDLYILPDKQKMGYGTKLLRYAIEQCTGIPTLWILENYFNAKRLYHKMGFQETGRSHAITEGMDEIELSLV